MLQYRLSRPGILTCSTFIICRRGLTTLPGHQTLMQTLDRNAGQLPSDLFRLSKQTLNPNTGHIRSKLSPASTQTLDQDVGHLRSDPSLADMQMLVIPAECRTRLLHAMEDLPSPYTSFEQHHRASCKAIVSHLDPSILAEVRNFHSNVFAPGAILISGLPLDPILPTTPMDGGRSTQKSTFVSEGCLIGITTIIGEPFSYVSEKNGELIHNVCPVQRAETVQSNESSNVDLSLHVENAYFDTRPEYLALFGLRQDHDKQALTSFVDVRSVLSKMSPTDRAELQKPMFIVPSPPSHHKAMGGEKWSSPRPVVNDPKDPTLICRFPGMKGLDQTSQKALDNFQQTLRHSNVVKHVALEPGSMLLLNNRKVAHGRSRFKPRYDGTDRWLQRVYVKA